MGMNEAALRTRLAMAVAQADGEVAPEERELIRKQAEARLRELSHAQRRRLETTLQGLEDKLHDDRAIATELSTALGEPERLELLAQLFDVALADGCFVPEERLLLERIYQLLHTDSEHFDRLLRNALQHKPTRDSDPELNALFERLRQRRLREKLEELLVPPEV